MLRLSGITAAAAVALIAAPGFSTAAEAGHRCRGEAIACYQKVKRPDIYRTVERRVMVRPARTEAYHSPAVVVNRAEHVVVEPGRLHHVHRPAVLGTVMQRKLVAPASISYHTTPAVVRTVHEDVVVHGGHQRWVTKHDRHGREIKCLVRTPAKTRTVARQVVVRPAVTVPVVQPAVYAHVPRTVVVRPATTVPVYEPPVTAVVHRPVVLRPAETHVVTRPAEYAIERHAVRVRSGGYHWQPVGGHHW